MDMLRIMRYMVAAGSALGVPGNHDAKLLKKLCCRDVRRATSASVKRSVAGIASTERAGASKSLSLRRRHERLP